LTSIFDFSSYKQYLTWREQTWEGRGFRQKLASAAQCQPSYVSQILNGVGDFSAEQAAQCHALLGHKPPEAHFFMLLVQMARAGTQTLQEYFLTQLQKAREEYKFLQNRIPQKENLSKQTQQIYYSTHINALIHVALTVEELRTPARLAARFGLPLELVRETLDFLVSAKLAAEQDGTYNVGPAQIHLGRESKLVSRHHVNWRVKSLENLDLATSRDLHYSSVISHSFADAPRIRNILVQALSEIQNIVKDSPAEEIFVLNTDLFNIK